jgi:gamma-glutamyl:cysteine ligase YbdK (ATP-grasp superfamily)
MEYMIVDCATLRARPISDRILAELNGGVITDEVEVGPIAWSNELVMHVLEMKTNGPAESLAAAYQATSEGVRQMNHQLLPHGCRLMPTAMHPMFHPATETVLWPHGYGEVYSAFDRVFNCRGHGWSNLQSIHINLPFANDHEFGRLHAAIRLVLPLIPAVAASSPLVEGRLTGFKDNRLEYYRQNQRRVPIIAGNLIPERIYTESEYRQLFSRIYSAISPFDLGGVLQNEFLNSRGAIARFQRNAIEIRVTDIQECPLADFAIIDAVCSLVRALVEQQWSDWEQQARISETDLLLTFLASVRDGLDATCQHSDYLRALGLGSAKASLREIWQHCHAAASKSAGRARHPMIQNFSKMLAAGSLSDRIMRRLGARPDRVAIQDVYRELSNCLDQERLFGV